MSLAGGLFPLLALYVWIIAKAKEENRKWTTVLNQIDHERLGEVRLFAEHWEACLPNTELEEDVPIFSDSPDSYTDDRVIRKGEAIAAKAAVLKREILKELAGNDDDWNGLFSPMTEPSTLSFISLQEDDAEGTFSVGIEFPQVPGIGDECLSFTALYEEWQMISLEQDH